VDTKALVSVSSFGVSSLRSALGPMVLPQYLSRPGLQLDLGLISLAPGPLRGPSNTFVPMSLGRFDIHAIVWKPQ
jgi:hypothetical protein